jgi:putative acetyltransferase
MEIRDATTTDAEAVRRVHRASIEELAPAEYDRDQVEAWARGSESADYAGTIESETVHFVVAEEDERVVGFGSLSFESPSEYEAAVDGEITGIYVHPDTARDGVGTTLLRVLEEVARNRGMTSVGLVASLNAVPFYEHHGYERVRTHSHEFPSHESTGVEGDVVEMRARL